MTDYFALLDQPRRPWLDPEALKEHFHKLTAAHHPDLSPDTGIDFSSITAGYQLLRNPKTRLRHLFELEFPDTLSEAKGIPSDLVDSFMQIASALASFANLVKKLGSAQSPLAKALLATEQSAVLSQLLAISENLVREENSILAELRQLDASWPGEKSALLDPLAQIAQKLSFLLKWSDQIREAILRLS